MNAWRMALRAGYKGFDLRPMCEEQNVVVFTFESVKNTNLSRYSPKQKPPGWKIKGSAQGSMSNFAWRIRAGDLIFIRDSKRNNAMVACAVAQGSPGELAYRFDPSSVVQHGRTTWRHTIPVKWIKGFKEFSYKDRSPNTSVLRLNEMESEYFSGFLSSPRATTDDDKSMDEFPEQGDQLVDAYPRMGKAFSRLIVPRHKSLANAFRLWLRTRHQTESQWERRQIDLRFVVRKTRVLAELKIAYGGQTRHAIREALGQILEYNYYPKRQAFDEWLLVLDATPEQSDLVFIERLRQQWGLPIFLGWQSSVAFTFHPPWPPVIV